MPKIENPLHQLDSDKARQDAIYRISYMAKAGTKGIRDLRANDFGTSQGRSAWPKNEVGRLNSPQKKCMTK